MRYTRRTFLHLAAASAAGWTVQPRATWAGEPPTSVRIAGGVAYQQGKIVLSGQAAIVDAQGWLAAELAKRQIKLDWFPVSHAATGPMINEGFASGTLDFGGYGDLPSLILNASSVQTRIIVPNGVGGAGGETFLVVPAGSTARSIDDLRGKRLAIHRGRPWEVPLLRLLESRGLSYADFKTFNIDPQAGATALAAGGIDALYTMTDAYALEERKVGRILWSTREAPGDWRMRTELWADQRFISRYPDITQLVTTAYVRAAQFAANEDNRDEVARLSARIGTPDEVVRRLYADRGADWRNRFSPLFGPALTQHYRATEELAFSKKLIGRRVDTERLFEPRFVQAAITELGLDGYWADPA